MKNVGIAQSTTRKISGMVKALIPVVCFLPAIGVQAGENRQSRETEATPASAAAPNQRQSHKPLLSPFGTL